MKLHRSLASLSVIAALAVAVSAALGQIPAYKLASMAAVGGDGGWDYLTYDASTKRLFISRGSHVMVVDPAKGTVVGDIAATTGVHGIAVAPELAKGFTSNGRDNSVTVFDLKTLAPITVVKIDGKNPDAIVYDPASKRVFVFNGASHDATILDAQTNAVVGTVPLGGKPEFAAPDGKGNMYVNVEDTAEIVAIDARNAKETKRFKVAPCEDPSGLAMDIKNRRIFIGCSNKIMGIVDPDAGKVVATVPIGAGSDAIGFDAATNLAFSSNGEGTLTVVHEDSPNAFSVLQTATTQPLARTMALDPTTHDVYLVTADFDQTPPAQPGGRPQRTMKPGTFRVLVMSRTP